MLHRLGDDLLEAVLGAVTSVDPADLRAVRCVNCECRDVVAATRLLEMHVWVCVKHHSERLDRSEILYQRSRKAMASDLVTGSRLTHVVRRHREAMHRHQAILVGLRGLCA